ncbi:PAS domain S-box protein [Haloarchaeobius sp. TZWWS8]|uniref:PAS domain-containing sensor histidine kinase n=1 Tax=Haloarchaeobius sp. TZWWS8 TaxID=3446121 RepID=UPI003EBE4D81
MQTELRLLYDVDDSAVAACVREAARTRPAVDALAITARDLSADHVCQGGSTTDCLVLTEQTDGVDALDVVERVRDEIPELPIVLCPAAGSEQLASDAIAGGVDDYVPADVAVADREAFVDRIRTAVERHAARTDQPAMEGFNDVLQRVTDAFFAIDDSWKVTYWNRQMEERTGRPAETVLGERLDEAFPAGTDTELFEQYRQAMESQEAFSVETFYEPGGYWLEVRGYPSENGLSIYSRNISGRKERELELERYETMVETVGNGVYTFDADYYFTAVNDAMTTLTGYDRDELIGLHASDIFDETDLQRAKRARQALLESPENVMTVERDILRADGETFPAEIHFGLLPFADEFRGTAGVMRDITEQKAQQKRLREQNERLDEFASVVSHDLRNPLNVASASLDLYRATDREDLLDDIEDANERMADIIDGVLTLARQGETVDDPTPTPLSSVVDLAWALVDTGGARLLNEVDATVAMDENRCRELLENLFRNAVEHGSTDYGTRSGDTVEHSSTSPQQAEDAVEYGSTSPQQAEDAVEHDLPESERGGPEETDSAAAGDPGTELTIRVGTTSDGFFVEDDGIGIPSVDRESVMQPSFTTNEHGTGFGLYIVEQIAEAHGWSVDVEASEEGGARFVFGDVELR